jgi:hypothetical protein
LRLYYAHPGAVWNLLPVRRYHNAAPRRGWFIPPPLLVGCVAGQNCSTGYAFGRFWRPFGRSEQIEFRRPPVGKPQCVIPSLHAAEGQSLYHWGSPGSSFFYKNYLFYLYFLNNLCYAKAVNSVIRYGNYWP